jgi:hypothetical protein
VVATHKFSGSSIVIRTCLIPERVAEISKHVGDVTKGDLAIGVNNVRFEGASAGRTSFSIRSFGDRVQLMTFHIEISQTAAGSSAHSRIDSFQTRQDKLFMLIPTGPKRMTGYKTYKRFMENLASAVRSEDAAVSATINETLAS